MTPSGRLLGAAAALAAIAGGVAGLAALTANRPDRLVDGTSTTVAFQVAVDDEHGMTVEIGAAALWHACRGTIPAHFAAPLTQIGANPARHMVTVSPALGDHGAQRLVGCLRDTTVDRVLATDVTLTPRPARSS